MDTLSTSRDFIKLYLHHTGISEIPEQFHLWSCLSLIASCVADRVWIERHADSKTAPNLYVFLLGASGVGKEKAINTAVRYVADHPLVNVYAGRATAPYLLDYMGRQEKKSDGTTGNVNSKLYFVTEELGMSVRSGDMAHDLITVMTKMYGGHDYPIKDGTRMHNTVVLRNPTVNWLAGTTEEWLFRSVDRDAIEGGFAPRVLCVRGHRDYTKRCPQVIYPKDYETVKAYLQERVQALTEIEGPFHLDPEAIAWHDQWYRSRQAPDDRQLQPSFNRGDELLHKLSILIALSEWDHQAVYDVPPIITKAHMTRALGMLETVLMEMPEVLRLASATPQTKNMDVVGEMIYKARIIDRSNLTKKCATKGLDAKDVDRALMTLFQQGVVEPGEPIPGSRAKIYKWVEKQ